MGVSELVRGGMKACHDYPSAPKLACPCFSIESPNAASRDWEQIGSGRSRSKRPDVVQGQEASGLGE